MENDVNVNIRVLLKLQENHDPVFLMKIVLFLEKGLVILYVSQISRLCFLKLHDFLWVRNITYIDEDT